MVIPLRFVLAFFQSSNEIELKLVSELKVSQNLTSFTLVPPIWNFPGLCLLHSCVSLKLGRFYDISPF